MGRFPGDFITYEGNISIFINSITCTIDDFTADCRIRLLCGVSINSRSSLVKGLPFSTIYSRRFIPWFPPPGEHHPRVQPERTLPEVQETQQEQRRQGQPVPVPSRPRGGGAGAARSQRPGGGVGNQEGQMRTVGIAQLGLWDGTCVSRSANSSSSSSSRSSSKCFQLVLLPNPTPSLPRFYLVV